MDAERLAVIHCNLIPGLDSPRIMRLQKIFGSLAAALTHTAGQWNELCGIPLPTAQKTLNPQTRNTAKDEMRKAAAKQIHILTCLDKEYPNYLQEIAAPPPVLYAKGNLDLLHPERLRLAIVGSRSPTLYGISQTQRFAAALSHQGFIIVSGLARGIDSCAHRACMQAGGSTIAVLGSGLLNVYPNDDPKLIQSIQENHLLLSEFPLDWLARKQHFPRRNRILAGLSKAVIVVQANLKSGSLITAQWGLDQGKEIFAIPGQIDQPWSAGCHFLIKQGACLIEQPEEILTALGLVANPTNAIHSNSQHPLLRILNTGAKTLDEICLLRNQSADEILLELVELELAGEIVRAPGGLYRCAIL